MAMLCWFYCIPFAKFLYFAFAPVVLIISLFMMKRGIRNARAGLRKAAFILIFLSLIKILALDVRSLNEDLICGVSAQMDDMGCNKNWLMGVEMLGLVLLVASSFVLFHYYRIFANIRQPTALKPEDVNLSFWANVCMVMIAAMVVWQCAPWAGYLTVGHVPDVFVKLPWQALAIVNFGLLLLGFWKAESCNWNYEVRHKKKMAHLNQTWTPRDTLWMCVFIYLLTLGLSYVAYDVLTSGGTRPIVTP